MRVLKSYVMRIKVAGGAGIIAYTEGAADSQIDTMLKATVDNIIHLDGEKIDVEAMTGCDNASANYKITDEGFCIICSSNNLFCPPCKHDDAYGYYTHSEISEYSSIRNFCKGSK